MKMTIDMAVVSECDVDECAYNSDGNCHARAITVGDGVHPGCDTFLNHSTHVKNVRQTAGVGACKVASCSHNDDFECSAGKISVGYNENEVNCLTFSAR